jgi:hypothetical protein
MEAGATTGKVFVRRDYNRMEGFRAELVKPTDELHSLQVLEVSHR